MTSFKKISSLQQHEVCDFFDWYDFACQLSESAFSGWLNLQDCWLVKRRSQSLTALWQAQDSVLCLQVTRQLLPDAIVLIHCPVLQGREYEKQNIPGFSPKQARLKPTNGSLPARAGLFSAGQLKDLYLLQPFKYALIIIFFEHDLQICICTYFTLRRF